MRRGHSKFFCVSKAEWKGNVLLWLPWSSSEHSFAQKLLNKNFVLFFGNTVSLLSWKISGTQGVFFTFFYI